MADVRSSRSHGVFHANIVVVFPMMMHGTLPFLPLCNAVLTLLSFARAGLLRMISATHCNCPTVCYLCSIESPVLYRVVLKFAVAMSPMG